MEVVWSNVIFYDFRSIKEVIILREQRLDDYFLVLLCLILIVDMVIYLKLDEFYLC